MKIKGDTRDDGENIYSTVFVQDFLGDAWFGHVGVLRATGVIIIIIERLFNTNVEKNGFT